MLKRRKKMHSVRFALLFVLCVLGSINCSARSIRLNKQAHKFSRDAPQHTIKRSNVLPMNGGYLTLGAYFVNLTIGEPKQELQVLVDTGSSNTAVPVARCSACGSGPFYAPEKSTTRKSISCSSTICQKCVPEGLDSDQCVFGPPFCAKETNSCGFAITYGGGSSALYGSYVMEKLCLGDLCGTAALGEILDQYYFQSNTDGSEEFFGILGLAYPFNACNPTCTTPIFEDIAKQNNLQNLVGMCLTGSNGGVMDLGFVDHAKFEGELQWVPVRTERWYNIGMKDILVGQTSAGLREFMFDTSNDVIGTFVDSGTSIIIVSPYSFESIKSIFQTKYAHLPGVMGGLFQPAGFSPGCITKQQMGDKLKDFPDIHFVVEGEKGVNVTLTVGPEQYLLNVENQEFCLGVVGSTSVGAVLGDVFMESYYVVFDRENNRLGFAPARDCSV